MLPLNSRRTSYVAGLLLKPDEWPPETHEDRDADIEMRRRISLFAGLIMRVKHAFLWDMAPLTMRLLEREAVSLQTFACYARTQAVDQLGIANRNERADRFLLFLSALPEPSKMLGVPGLQGVAHHERALLRSRRATSRSNRKSDASFSFGVARRGLRLAVGTVVSGYDDSPFGESGCRVCPISDANVLVATNAGNAVLVSDQIGRALLSAVIAQDYLNTKATVNGLNAKRVADLIQAGVVAEELVWTP